jgi:disulfide bond formation protein DsbB
VRAPLGLAKALALLVPLAALAAAFGSQYLGGLVPCDMCWWQRYAHLAALPFAVGALALGAGRGRPLVWLAVLAIAASGAIGFYHAGVEYGYFEGFTRCTSTIAATGSTDDFLKALMDSPLVRCDEVQWSFLGISMAGWNAILSLAGALVILWLSLRRPRSA